MKIIHISHLYHPSSGGVQFFFKNVSERLVKDYGDDVTVVTTNSYYGPERKLFKKIDPAEEVINGVKVIRFSYERRHLKFYSIFFKVLKRLSIKPSGRMLLHANGPYSLKMKRFLTTVDADVFCGSSSNYYHMQFPLWRKCPFFYYGSIHLDESSNDNLLYPQQLKSINASTLYLANTNYEKEKLTKAGVKKDKIFVLGTGVDMVPFVAASSSEVLTYKIRIGIPQEGLVIGYVGRIERTKNVQLLIKAFEKVAQQNSKLYLLIAGAGSSYVEELKSLCKTFSPNIGERIKWLINFPIAEKGLVFNSLDVLVLPSHNESFGLVFLEAWSCKKPVIGASIGAVRDVIKDGVDGLLMDKDNEQSLVEKLKKLISNEPLRKQMGEHGFDKVKANYTWDIIVARLRQCYVDGMKTQVNNV